MIKRNYFSVVWFTPWLVPRSVAFWPMTGEKGKGDFRIDRVLSTLVSAQPEPLKLSGESAGNIRKGEIRVIVLTPIRLFGDGLCVCIRSKQHFQVLAVVNDLNGLSRALATERTDLALIDVTQDIDLVEVRAIAAQWPDVALVALGLREQKQDVIQCGRAGFAGYVGRDASLESLCEALKEIASGKLDCSPEISGGLLRALFGSERRDERSGEDLGLTRRECEVLELLGRGLSNKEISAELCLSVATVKHHVHHILEKLKLTSRAQAMRRVRDAPWIVRTAFSRGVAQKSNG